MKTDLVHLTDMQQAIQRIQTYTAGMDEAAFVADERTRSACEYELIALGEAGKAVSPRTQRQLSGVRWTQLRLMRNMLAHEHYQVSPNTLWRTLQIDLPPMLARLEQALAGG